jgi:hypothetical protein
VITEVNADPIPTGPENPHGNAFKVGRQRVWGSARRHRRPPDFSRFAPRGAHADALPALTPPPRPTPPRQVSETPLLSVHAAMRSADPFRSRAWKVKNPKVSGRALWARAAANPACTRECSTLLASTDPSRPFRLPPPPAPPGHQPHHWPACGLQARAHPQHAHARAPREPRGQARLLRHQAPLCHAPPRRPGGRQATPASEMGSSCPTAASALRTRHPRPPGFASPQTLPAHTLQPALLSPCSATPRATTWCSPRTASACASGLPTTRRSPAPTP